MKTIPDIYKDDETMAIYAPVVCFSGEMVITAGQCCDDVEGFEGDIPEDIATQTRLAIQACKEKLEACGTSLANVVFVEVNLANMDDWPSFNQVYKQLMPDPKPARKAIGVQLLAGYKVELVMLATK